MAVLSLPVLLLGAAAALLFFIYSSQNKKLSKDGIEAPPGPPGLPILGNMHQIPKTGAHFKLVDTTSAKEPTGVPY